MGWLVWLSSADYRAQFRANVAQAGLPFAAARPAIAEAGRFVGELPKIWMRPRSQSCLEQVRVEGQAHANQAFALGKGIIFVAPHCGSFEMGTQAVAELFGPLTALYRPARQAWLAQLEAIARNRHQLTMVTPSLGGIRQMHKILKANHAVAMLTDQVPPEGWGVWAPFFGKPAYTMTLAARLARKTGAVLLPVSCERLPGAQGYFLKIWPALAGLDAGEKPDLQQAVTQINQAIEAIVRSQPGQYLWGYARYKTPREEIT